MSQDLGGDVRLPQVRKPEILSDMNAKRSVCRLLLKKLFLARVLIFYDALKTLRNTEVLLGP
jgi:hypothetical protein